MKQLLLPIVLILVASPSVIFADSINSTTEASSDSGGNVVGPGGQIRTGDESASVFQYTSVNGNGVVESRVTTEQNGVRTTEVRTENLAPTGRVDIRIATSSSQSLREDARQGEGPSAAAAATTVKSNSAGTSILVEVHVVSKGTVFSTTTPKLRLVPKIPNTGETATRTVEQASSSWFMTLLQSFAFVAKTLFSSLFGRQ